MEKGPSYTRNKLLFLYIIFNVVVEQKTTKKKPTIKELQGRKIVLQPRILILKNAMNVFEIE